MYYNVIKHISISMTVIIIMLSELQHTIGQLRMLTFFRYYYTEITS